VFGFAAHVTIQGRKRWVEGELVLGGRTKAGEVLRGAESAGPEALSLFRGLAGRVPVVGKMTGEIAGKVVGGVGNVVHAGQEIFGIDGIDGPPAEVAPEGESTQVRLSVPDQHQAPFGPVVLPCGAGRLTVRGIPASGEILLALRPA
jgi:hypothetical protein